MIRLPGNFITKVVENNKNNNWESMGKVLPMPKKSTKCWQKEY